MQARSAKKRVFSRRVAGIFAAIVFLAIIALSAGSVSVNFVSRSVLDAAAEKLPADAHISFADIRFSLGAGTAILDLHDLNLDRPGRSRLHASMLRTRVSILSLLGGAVRPVGIELDDLTLTVDKIDRPQTQISPVAGTSRTETARQLLATLTDAVNDGHQAMLKLGLQQVLINDIKVNGAALDEFSVHAELPLRIAEMNWLSDTDESDFSVKLESGLGDWSMRLGTGNRSNAKSVTFSVTGFPPSILFGSLGVPPDRLRLTTQANLFGRIDLTPEGTFDTARLEMSLQPGRLTIRDRDSIAIDRSDIAVELSSGSDLLRFVNGDIRSGKARIAFAAEVDPGQYGHPIGITAKLIGGRLASLPHEEPIDLEGGSARLTLDPTSRQIILEGASLGGPDGSIALNGAFSASGKDAGLTGQLETKEATANLVYALWPPMVAREARNWFGRNVKSGLVGPGMLRIDLPLENLRADRRGRELPPDGITGEVAIRFGLFSPMPDMPLVRNASGSLKFEAAVLAVNLRAGRIVAAGLGEADAGQTFFRIPHLGRPNATGYLDLNLSGPAAVLARLSNSGRLSIAEDRGVDPADLTGEAQLSLFAEIPLGGVGRRDNVRAEFDLNLTDFASSAPLAAGRYVTGGRLNLTGSLEKYSLTGNASIDGIPTYIEIESGQQAGPVPVRVTLDADARRAMGINLGPYLSGPVVALVDSNAADPNQISLDLTSADINVPFAGWHKVAGVAASFQALMVRSENGTELSNIAFFGDGFDVTGDLSVDRHGNLITLNAPHVRLREHDRFSVNAKKLGDAVQVEISGESIDVRGLISELQKDVSTGRSSSGNIDIKLSVNRLLGHNGVTMDDVTGEARIADATVRSLSIRLGNSLDRIVDLTTDDNSASKVVVRYRNAGNLLRFLNVYRTIYGGSIAIDYSSPEIGRGSGNLNIAKFRAQEGERNISVSRLSIPFSRNGQTINIYKARMQADGLDATAKGGINLDARSISIRGTVVPTNGLNRLPASVPIVGDLLGARKRKGLIGIAFTLAGPLSSPQLKLNVASAVTPGIVRRLFRSKRN